MTEPMVRDWAEAGSEITVAALPHIAPVYRSIPSVTHVLEWSFKRKTLQLIKRFQISRELRGQYDLCVICPNSFKSALIPWFAAIPDRIAYLGEFRGWFLTQSLSNPERNHRGSMVSFYKALGPLGKEKPSTLDLVTNAPYLKVKESLITRALSLYGLTKGAYTVIAPGAEYGSAKRWPAEYYAELVSRVSQSGGTVIILGSKNDQAVAQQIKKDSELRNSKIGSDIRNLAGETELLQAIALIAAAKCMVSNDSGLMHIGAALGVPQVAIFGSSSPLHTPPLSNKAKVIWLSLPCAPCFKRVCPLGHLKCLRDIDVGQVEAALKIACS